MEDVTEFIDTYSDDLITIHEARAASYTHPLRSDFAFAESLLDASFCRILIVFVIGGIEALLESWQDRDKLNVLDKYFAKGVSNGDRIKSLCNAFLNAGIQVDEDVFNDYLAIKYLRNTIIHHGWRSKERDWIDERGFPRDTRELKKEHLDRIEHVNQNMMLYIALTGMTDPNSTKPSKLIKLDETITRRRDESGIISVRDISRIIWNNLERIDNHIYSDIEKAATTNEYNWTKGYTNTELEALGYDECKRLFFLAARRASEENYEPLVRHRVMAQEALQFWREYWQRVVVKIEDSVRPALDVLSSSDFNPEMPEWSVIANAKEDIAQELVDQFLTEDGLFTSKQIVNALQAGKSAYKLVPNIMPVALLTIRLPIVDPPNTLEYLQEAERALEIFQLNRAWYECVEHQCRLTDDTLGFYALMIREFSQRQCGE